MNLQLRIRHLSTTMIKWAEENKIRTNTNADYKIPQRSGVDWTEDFTFVTKLDSMLTNGSDVTLKKNEMKMCNELYEFYRPNNQFKKY